MLLLAKAASAGKDTAFKQPVSIKYQMPADLQNGMLKKTVVDYNDVAYVLSDKGLYRVNENSVVKDLRYTPLAQLTPLDITVQENTGNCLIYTTINGLAMPMQVCLKQGILRTIMHKLPLHQTVMFLYAAKMQLLYTGELQSYQLHL